MNPAIIEYQKGQLQVPDHPIIPFIEGDGIGPGIWRTTQKVIDAAINYAYGEKRKIQWLELLAGQKAFNTTGEWLPQKTLDLIKRHRIVLKGPLTMPMGGGIRSLKVVLQQKLDLYAHVRPIQYLAGIPSPVLHPEKIEVMVFRENTEGVSAGIEFGSGTIKTETFLEFLTDELPEEYMKIGFGGYEKVAAYQQSLERDTPVRVEVGIGVKSISRQGTERLVRSAISSALRHGRTRLTLVHKGNVMKHTEGAFRDWGYQLAEKEFGDQVYTWAQYDRTAAMEGMIAANSQKENAREAGKLLVDDMLINVAFQQMLVRPETFDVIAATHVNGEYLADALVAQVGGVGITPVAHLNEVAGYGIFEPSHGTNPRLKHLDKANPSSMILAAAFLLRYIGWNEAAERIGKGVSAAFLQKRLTRDLAGRVSSATEVSCSEFGEQIVQMMN